MVALEEVVQSRNALSESKYLAEDRIIDKLMSVSDTIIMELLRMHDSSATNYCVEFADALEQMVHQKLIFSCRSEYQALGIGLSADFEARLAVRLNKYIRNLFIRLKEEQGRTTSLAG